THVATMLREVSRSHQVLCITHLASIACYADAHYQVTKTVVDSRTQSHIMLLDASSRVAEIARMMGGATMTAKTLEHAAEMIAEVRREAEQ
ncbi:MAG: DNA repair protein RecN, partial [Proteobacteria bacterium]|nr:DNA repair protein RecN [Pseudomonadota bacterium]